MQSTFCTNCGQPLPAGSAFCGSCGARQTPNQPPANNAPPAQGAPAPTPAAVSDAPTQLTPPPPPPTGDNTPTQLTPPPPPDATLRADAPPVHDPYASQYNAAPPPAPSGPSSFSQYNGPVMSGPYPPPPGQQAPFAPPPAPPGYAPGPPPVMTPGGVAPWAQPQKKSGRRFALGCVVAIVLVVLVLSGGGVLAYRLLSSGKSGSTSSSNHPGSTPGSSNPGSTPGTGSTTTSPGGAQTLDNLNLQAIYAGVTVTVMNATQAPSVPEYTPNDPNQDALKMQVRLDNSQDTHGVFVSNNARVVGPSGNPYDVTNGGASNSLPLSVDGQANILGYWYFAVPHGTNISDWKLVLGAATELQETIPLNGVGYDPSVWQWVTKPITEKNTVTYYGGALTGTVTKVTTGVWTPGFQAPQGMRFILVDLKVTNNSAGSAYVGDPEFALLQPNQERQNQNTLYGYFINEVLGGHESKDVGYICFVVPPDKGDFQMLFFNQDNGIAAMIDLGTL